MPQPPRPPRSSSGDSSRQRGPSGPRPPRPRFDSRPLGGGHHGVGPAPPDSRNRDRHPKPPLVLQPTTLWDYPSQHYGDDVQGDPNYKGATPSYIIWNLLERYTKPKDLVVDPCAGSGTTLDVARDLGRRAVGYDLAPPRPDIYRADARQLPLESEKADFVFIDPPYSTHIEYSDDPRCIGKLDASGPEYYDAMAQVISEIDRILKPNRAMALYVCDSFVKGRGFYPIGFELFSILRRHFTPVDIVAVTRHNRTLDMGNYRAAAEEGNFFLRGFNYLFIMWKEAEKRAKSASQASAPSAASAPKAIDGPPRESRPARDSRPPREVRGPRESRDDKPGGPIPKWQRGPNRRPFRRSR